MWAVLSLIATGVDSTLDPARFSVLPLRAAELARGLLAAALTGIPAVMLVRPGAGPGGGVGHAPGGGGGRPRRSGARGAHRGAALARRHERAGPGHDDAGRDASSGPSSSRSSRSCRSGSTCSSRPARSRPTSRPSTRRARRWSRRGHRSGWAWGLPFDVATGRWGSALVAPRARRRRSSPSCGRCGCVSSRAPSPRRSRARAASGSVPVASCPPCSAPRRPRPIAARRVRAWYRDSRLVGIALRTAVLPVFFVVQAVVTGTDGLAGRRHRDARGLRGPDPDERPRLRRPRLVAARRRRASRAGRTGSAGRSRRSSSSARSSSSRMP